MNFMKKIEIKFIAIAAILITIITVGVVKAYETDLSKIEGKGKNAINSIFSLGYNSIAGKTNTYCIQHHKALRSETKKYIVDKYVEIDGKTATVYKSSSDRGTEVKSNYNAIVSYIFSKQQGYGDANSNTEGQKALWHYANKWVNALFGKGNDYYWEKNNGVSIAGNSVAEEAKEYAKKVGNTTSDSDEELNMEDKTPNKNKLRLLDVGGGYYRVGPFKWKFDGTLTSISVKADGNKVTDVRFVKYVGHDAKKIDVSKIESGDEFYVDIKNASNITKVHLDLMANKSFSSFITTKVWFLKTSSEYQNLVHVESSNEQKMISGGGSTDYSISTDDDNDFDINFPSITQVGIIKVDDRDNNKKLEDVGFIFRANVQSYDLVGTVDHYENVTHRDPITNETYVTREYSWTENKYEWRTHVVYVDNNDKWSEIDQNSAKVFKTDEDGKIGEQDITFNKTLVTNRSENDEGTYVEAKFADDPNLTAIEVSNPYYGYEGEIGKEYALDSINETKLLTNHQNLIKLSGYVWLEENQGKTTLNDDMYNEGTEDGVDGIKVYLKDTAGNVVKETTTSELGLYDEIESGEYQFTDVNLDELQAGNYHVEFEYGGMTYQSVNPKLTEQEGSKAIDTNSRNVLDNKFTSVNGNGTQSLDINGVKANYSQTSDHVSTVNSYENDSVCARTDEAGYNIYSYYEPAQEEIRYINLGLFERQKTDYAIKTELHNVRVTVNGSSHVYKYGTRQEVSESSWNVGVKFQLNNGNYSRAIYASDLAYSSPDAGRELKVYATYIIDLKNQSPYLSRINNIVDYCDGNISSVKVGNNINDNYEISDDINKEFMGQYGSYSKYRIDVNSVIEPGTEKVLYVEYELNKEAVLSLINNGKMLNHISEINSYTTFKDNNVNQTLAVVDGMSVPGNAIPGNINTYENDTDGARSLKLELKGARAVSGTVFVDNSEVTDNNERKGNGKFDNGEATLKGVTVKLINTETNEVAGETTTDDNGNFKITGFIPANYKLVYIWGDKEHQVQWYKSTIYDKNRNQGDVYWYKTNSGERYTDALDNHNTRTSIDDEMRRVTTNTLEQQISDAYEDGYNPEGKNITITKMDSYTPTMKIDVEYDTTVTNGVEDRVEFEIQNVDFGIVERPKQALQLTKRISGYRIKLANGQVLVDATIDENGNLNGTHQNTTYIKPTVTASGTIDIGQLKTEMDSELIEGATLETVYAMTAKNVSELDYSDENYYDYGEPTDRNRNKVTISVAELLDYVDRRLNNVTPEGQWTEKDQEYLKQVNASKKEAEDINNYGIYTTNKLVKALAPGDTTDVMNLYTSKLLTSSDDNTFNNKSEITQITKNDGFISGTPVKLIENHFAIGDSEKIIIIPSTGENKNYVLPITIGITAIVILGAGIVLIKKFIIDKK